MNIMDLPNEVLAQILVNLSPLELAKAASVCQKFSDVARECLWENGQVMRSRREICEGEMW